MWLGVIIGTVIYFFLALMGGSIPLVTQIDLSQLQEADISLNNAVTILYTALAVIVIQPLSIFIGGYMGGRFSPQREFRTAGIICFNASLLAAFLTHENDSRRAAIREYFEGNSFVFSTFEYEFVFLSALNYVYMFLLFILGGLLAKGVAHYKESRVFGPNYLNIISRFTLSSSGWLALLYGPIVTAFAIVAFIYLYDLLSTIRFRDMSEYYLLKYGGSITLFFLVFFGGGLYQKGIALIKASKSQVIAGADVLVLRSFKDDGLQLERKFFFLAYIWHIGEILNFILAPYIGNGYFVMVARKFSLLGNVVLLGSPNEDLPLTNASRPYFSVSTEEWKVYVTSCMENSRLIAILPGQTAGLAWEMKEILSLGHLNKTILLLPPTEGIEKNRLRIGNFFKSVAIEEPGESMDKVTATTIALTFNNSSKPELINADTKYYEDVARSFEDLANYIDGRQDVLEVLIDSRDEKYFKEPTYELDNEYNCSCAMAEWKWDKDACCWVCQGCGELQ